MTQSASQPLPGQACWLTADVPGATGLVGRACGLRTMLQGGAYGEVHAMVACSLGGAGGTQIHESDQIEHMGMVHNSVVVR